MKHKQISEHLEILTLHETVVIPEHGERDTTAFRRSVERLKKDGFYFCAICGEVKNLQVHHISEFCFENITDFNKLKDVLIRFDIYGYGELLKDEPITSVDDVRNLIVLCQPHHTGKGTGIHYLSFPMFLAQRTCFINPVPQKNEAIAQVEERIKNVQRSCDL